MTENWYTCYFRSVIPNPDLDFWHFNSKIHFWANLRRKSQSCLFCLKIDTQSISRMLIITPTLVFWISNLNSIFWSNLNCKAQVFRFAWILAHIISWGCLFFLQYSFSKNPNLNLEDAGFYFDINPFFGQI